MGWLYRAGHKNGASVCLSACHSTPDAAAAEEESWGDLWEELDRELGLDESVPPLSAG